MAVKKIVLAFEGSEGSKKALEWALEFAKQSQAEIHVVTILESVGMISLEPTSQLIDMENIREQYLQQLNESTAKLCDGYSCTVRTKVLEGNAADELINYAKQQHADLLVCGTRGLGNFTSLLLGSVAHKLVTYADMPVLVVK
ncbi:universal stress protein [Azotosporobacter soli]|uniref:universal stress protein n=1 Tax=Azotosporobacter soli TaxID=3055040 RepID=UPI0031FEF223